MNKLPKVLQNEIWEYVHGDRQHFRNNLYQKVIDELHQIIETTETYLVGSTDKRIETLFQSIRPGPWQASQWMWTEHVPDFMKHQHKVHGQLFVDNHDEYLIKRNEWFSWHDAQDVSRFIGGRRLVDNQQ